MADLSSTRALVQRHAAAVMTKTAKRVETDTRIATPVGLTGGLRRNVKAGPVASAGATVTFTLVADRTYAGYVADGTRPHQIRPRRAKVLRFVTGGQVVFARVVNHPGTGPTPEWWSEPVHTTRFRRALEVAARATVTEG